LHQADPRERLKAGRKSARSALFRVSVLVPVLVVAAAATGFFVYANRSTAAVRNAADANANCSLVVPADPLSATGLSTPYQLTATDQAGGPCNEANADQSAFVEAAVIDPASGAVSVYRPLVIDQGTKPAAPPVVPTLPAGAIVGIWYGFNGDTLTLQGTGDSLNQGNCVNGAQDSLFGQFAYCDAPQFFTAANKAITAGQLAIPKLGTATDGMACPTTRDFGLIDQDQSDNLVTTYLVLADGTVAQNNDANTKALAGSNPIVNGSDNLLLDAFVDPALGCTPFTAPDLTNAGAPVSSLALDELLAAASQQDPIALVPTNDPMTLVGGQPDENKTNLYRVGVDQPPVNAATDTPTAYCTNLVQVGTQRVQLDKDLTVGAPSPDPAAANNLFTFDANRLSQSFTNLGCLDLLNIADPITITTDGNGVAVDATFSTTTAPCGPSTTTTAPTTTGTDPGGPTTTDPGAPTTTGTTTTGTTTTTDATDPTTAPSDTGTVTSTAPMAANHYPPPGTTTTDPATTDPTSADPTATDPATTTPPTTTTTTCASAPAPTTSTPTSTTNADANAANRAPHRPSKY
jgi:hypothetical protein